MKERRRQQQRIARKSERHLDGQERAERQTQFQRLVESMTHRNPEQGDERAGDDIGLHQENPPIVERVRKMEVPDDQRGGQVDTQSRGESPVFAPPPDSHHGPG